MGWAIYWVCSGRASHMSYKSTCSPQSPCRSPSQQTTNHVRQPWRANNTRIGRAQTPPPPPTPTETQKKQESRATIKKSPSASTLTWHFAVRAGWAPWFLRRRDPPLKEPCILMLELFGGLHPSNPNYWAPAPPSHKIMLIPQKSL